MKVSVLLPAFNAAATVARAVGSIRAQTRPDWELLVIDDGSTDATAQVVAAASADDARVRLIRRPHEGLVAALNVGLADAQGELIARMDADDESLPGRLEQQTALLDAHGEVGVCGCLVEFGGDRSANAGYALHVDWLNSLVTPDEILLNRFIESPFAHPSVMFRRELVATHGGYRGGGFPEDYELWLRWAEAGVRMAKVPRTLLRWNDAPTRLSRTDPRYAPDAFFRTKARWIARDLFRRGMAEATPGATTTAPADLGSPAAATRSRSIWIWGAGRPTRKRAAFLREHGIRISGYIDVDAKKAGHRVEGVPVVLPTEFPPPDDAFVLGYVSSRGARALIREQLRSCGYVEGRDFLMCA